MPCPRWSGCATSCRGSATRWSGAKAFAVELADRGFWLQPDPPHTNTFQAYAVGDADAITERVVEFMEKEHLAPSGGWWAARHRGSR